MKPIKIVVVEENRNILEIVRLNLEKEGFTVLTSSNAIDGLHLIESVVPDVVLLDVNLPNEEGFKLAKRFRELSDGVLIFISSKKTKDKILQGFDIGCDDFITIPFDPAELVIRVKANIRRAEKKTEDILRVGELVIDYQNASVYKNGELLDLAKKEKKLLFYLSQHPNQVVSSQLLYDVVWGYDSFSELKTVSVHMSTLRKKIDNSAYPKYIETIRGFGYKFSSQSFNRR